MSKPLKIIVLLVVVGLYSSISLANSSQADGELQFSAEKLMRFAKRVEKVAADNGARVIIIPRLGRPRSKLPRGFEYTHTGIGVYSLITTESGETVPGYRIHNLYQSNEQSDRSTTVDDFPFDFYAGVYELKTAVLIPKPELQQKLLKLIQSGDHLQLHNANYSAISNPYNTKYQNCNEYVLDIINAAVYGTTDIAKLKQTSETYFDAQPVVVGPLKMMFASIFSPSIKVSDQSEDIITTSYTSIKDYLYKYDLVDKEIIINAQP